jgi:protein-disulfide isomerase
MSENHEKSSSVTIKKDTLWKGAVAVLAVLFIISLVTGGFGGLGKTENQPNIPGNGGEELDIQVSITGEDPIIGNVNAKVSIVEWSDFECPFCSRAYFGPVSDLKNSDYFKNGDVNFVYKHFPLTQIHPNAQKSAEAAECARQQGNDEFWEYHDLLFANQDKLGTSDLKKYAQNAGLNVAAFNSCLDNGDGADKVASDLQEGIEAGCQGTPYFVVINNDNGEVTTVSGAVPYASTSPQGLAAAIKAVL